MAIKTNESRAAAWLNLEILGANGTKRRLRVGVPLESGHRIDDLILSAAKADPEREFSLVGTVRFISDDDDFEL